MSKTLIYERFEYFLEDFDCQWCLYYLRKSKFRRNGCNCDTSRFEEEKRDALEHGRIKRPQPISCHG